MTADIDAAFREQLSGQPRQRFEAIVLASQSLDLLLDILPDDVEVRREYRLVPGVEVRAPGATLLGLAGDRRVKSIEPVRTVKSM